MSQPLPGLDRRASKSEIRASRSTVHLNPRGVIVGVLFLAIIGLAIWYLARPEPLLVQGKWKAPGSTSQPGSLAASSRFRLDAARM
jgi:hypothetical protein